MTRPPTEAGLRVPSGRGVLPVPRGRLTHAIVGPFRATLPGAPDRWIQTPSIRTAPRGRGKNQPLPWDCRPSKPRQHVKLHSVPKGAIASIQKGPAVHGPFWRMAKGARIRRILAGNVRRLREAKGLSQGALAADAGSTKSLSAGSKTARPRVGHAGQDRCRPRCAPA